MVHDWLFAGLDAQNTTQCHSSPVAYRGLLCACRPAVWALVIRVGSLGALGEGGGWMFSTLNIKSPGQFQIIFPNFKFLFWSTASDRWSKCSESSMIKTHKWLKRTPSDFGRQQLFYKQTINEFLFRMAQFSLRWNSSMKLTCTWRECDTGKYDVRTISQSLPNHLKMLDALVMCFDLCVWLRVKNHYRYILTYHPKRIYCSWKMPHFIAFPPLPRTVGAFWE